MGLSTHRGSAVVTAHALHPPISRPRASTGTGRTDPRTKPKEDSTMFQPSSILATYTTVLLWAFFALIAGGCGTDSATRPDTSTPIDHAAPITPGGMGLADQTVNKFMVTWAPNVDPDLAGYRVYLYDPNPSRANAYVCVTGPNLCRATSLTYQGVPGTTYCFRVTAVDTSGNESAMSEPFTFGFSVGDNPEETDAGDGLHGGTREVGPGHDWPPYQHNEDGSSR
jgi:hypothetical protein